MRTIYKCITCKIVLDDQINKGITYRTRTVGRKQKTEKVAICPQCSNPLVEITKLR